MQRLVSLIDDPRAVTLAVAALISAALWVATWSTMGQMDMGAMGMGDMGMSDMGAEGMGEDATDGDTMSMQGMGDADAMGGMSGMSGMAWMHGTDWSFATLQAAFLMWVLMMAAMMLPAMAPILAIYAGLAAREDRGLRLALRVTVFTLGYFLLWIAVSLALACAQLALRDSAWFTMGGTLATWPVAALLLVVAGLYQFTPLKAACLRHCRHPLTFLLSHWRDGLAGAFPVGLHHGLYCVGCCVLFMGLMFVFGAMNVWWMAAIALYFLAEKVAPEAERWGQAVGVVLVAAGAWVAVSGLT